MINHEDIDDGPITSRLHKTCLCPWCCLPCNTLLFPCRKAVSGNKKRLERDGFSLDLAYVHPRIIVHGFPAVGIEHLYRNPRYELRRYLDRYHYDHYKMYNFCCEYGRGYDPSVFHGRVERYPFKDHNTPPLETMASFANSAKAWLDANPANVVNMHCKAGKGRAGLMCCVLLVRTGYAKSAKEALDIYDRERVTNNRGLTVTSQRKYVIFYEQLWRKCWNISGDIGRISASKSKSKKYPMPIQPEYTFYGVELLNLDNGVTLKNLRIKIYAIGSFSPQLMNDTQFVKLDGTPVIEYEGLLKPNFKIQVFTKPSFFKRSVKLFELIHNTYFMDISNGSSDFGIDQLDIKKKMKAKLGTNLVLRIILEAPMKNSGNPSGHNEEKGYEMIKLNPREAML